MRHDKRKQSACTGLEAELNAFVDGELEVLKMEQVTNHLMECPGCQRFVDKIRDLAHLHRSAKNENEVLSAFNSTAIYQSITSELISEKIPKIAELFYQIGKAYLAKGLQTKDYVLTKVTKVVNKINMEMSTPPVSIERGKLQTGRLLREIDDLAKSSGMTGNQTHKKAQTFFHQTNKSKDDILELGRGFMEESLLIDPNKAEPTIYLGVYYYLGIKDYENGIQQFKLALECEDISEENKTIALMNLGSIYSILYKYDEAAASFEEIEMSGVLNRHPRFYRCLVYLAATYAKLGEYNQSVTTFDKTVKSFPKHADQIKTELGKMDTFQQVIKKQPGFRRSLEERVPVLFAS